MSTADAAALRAHVEQLGIARVSGGVGGVTVRHTPQGIEITHFDRTITVDFELVDLADAELLSFAIAPDAIGDPCGVLTIRAKNGTLRYRVLGDDGTAWHRVVCGLIDAPREPADISAVAGMLERRVRRILVVTLNFQHFAWWCGEHGISARDNRVLHMRNDRYLRGSVDQPYLVVDWPERFDFGVPIGYMMATLRMCYALEINDATATAWLAVTTRPPRK